MCCCFCPNRKKRNDHSGAEQTVYQFAVVFRFFFGIKGMESSSAESNDTAAVAAVSPGKGESHGEQPQNTRHTPPCSSTTPRAEWGINSKNSSPSLQREGTDSATTATATTAATTPLCSSSSSAPLAASHVVSTTTASVDSPNPRHPTTTASTVGLARTTRAPVGGDAGVLQRAASAYMTPAPSISKASSIRCSEEKDCRSRLESAVAELAKRSAEIEQLKQDLATEKLNVQQLLNDSSDADRSTRIVDMQRLIGTLSQQIRAKNLEVSKIQADCQAKAQKELTRALTETQAGTDELRAQVAALETKLRSTQHETERLKLHVRQSEEKLHQEVERHRNCKVLLTLAEKEVSVARQSTEAQSRQHEDERKKLVEQVTVLRRQASEATQKIISLQQQIQQSTPPPLASPLPQQGAAAVTPPSTSPTPPLAPGSPSPSSSVSGNNSARQQQQESMSSRARSQTMVTGGGAAMASPPPSALASLQQTSLLRNSFAREDSSKSLRQQIVSLQTQVEDRNKLVEQLQRESQQSAVETAKLEESFKQQVDEAQHRVLQLESDLKSALQREARLKEELDEAHEAYETELSSLSRNLSKWRTEQQEQQSTRCRSVSQAQQQQVTMAATPSQNKYLSTTVLISEGRSDSSDDEDVDLEDADKDEEDSCTIEADNDKAVAATAASAEATNPSSSIIHSNSSSTVAAAAATQQVDVAVDQDEQLHAALVVQLRREVAERDTTILDLHAAAARYRDRIALLEESRRGLLSEIQILKQHSNHHAIRNNNVNDDDGGVVAVSSSPPSAVTHHRAATPLTRSEIRQAYGSNTGSGSSSARTTVVGNTMNNPEQSPSSADAGGGGGGHDGNTEWPQTSMDIPMTHTHHHGLMGVVVPHLPPPPRGISPAPSSSQLLNVDDELAQTRFQLLRLQEDLSMLRRHVLRGGGGGGNAREDDDDLMMPSPSRPPTRPRLATQSQRQRVDNNHTQDSVSLTQHHVLCVDRDATGRGREDERQHPDDDNEPQHYNADEGNRRDITVDLLSSESASSPSPRRTAATRSSTRRQENSSSPGAGLTTPRAATALLFAGAALGVAAAQVLRNR